LRISVAAAGSPPAAVVACEAAAHLHRVWSDRGKAVRSEAKSTKRTAPKAARLRSRTPRDQSQSERQRAYRAKLLERAEPEADDVDQAVVVVMRRWMIRVRADLKAQAAANVAAGRDARYHETAEMAYHAGFATRLLEEVVAELGRRGYAKKPSERKSQLRLYKSPRKAGRKPSETPVSPPASGMQERLGSLGDGGVSG
jgi:hypothetical protein